MEVSGIKEEVEVDLKVEEYLSSNVCKNEVTSKEEPIDIKTEEDPQKTPVNLVTKVDTENDTFMNEKFDQDPSEDEDEEEEEEMELEVEPESENSLNGESEISSDSDSESDEEYQKQIRKKSTRQNQSTKKTKSSVKNQESKLQCPLCPQSFPWIRLLINHARKKHATIKTSRSDPRSDGESSLQCPLCPKSLVSVCGLQGHFLNFHIKDKPFQCKICLETTNEIKKFPTKAILQRHITLTHDESRFKFHCDLCPRKFACSFHFQNHKDMHLGKTFKCEYCSKNYRKKERMLRHIIAVHKEHCDKLETLKCDFCDDVFCSNKDLEYHVLQTHVADAVQCKICSKKFLVEGELIKHLTVAHRQNRTWLVCDVCSKAFKNNKDLVQHLEVEHQRFFKCRKCFRSFVSNEEYESHSTEIPDDEGISNSKKSQFQCKICLIFLNTECSFTTHKDTHLKPGEISRKNSVPLQPSDLQGCPLKCDFCPKTFQQKFLLLEHASKCHPNEKWDCKSCEKSFQLKYQLTQHEMLHATSKPFECQVCHKSFTNVGYLKQHEENHKEEKKYKCSKCEKTFALSSGLRLHTANHHGAEKPFKCHTCEKSFALKTHLNLHLLSHTDERPFGCDQCPGFFKCLKHLNNHKRKSHGKNSRVGNGCQRKPRSNYVENLVFVCSVNECDFETKNQKEVAVHNVKHRLPKVIISRSLPSSVSEASSSISTRIKKRTIQARYKCTECLKTLSSPGNLTKHRKMFHGPKQKKGKKRTYVSSSSSSSDSDEDLEDEIY